VTGRNNRLDTNLTYTSCPIAFAVYKKEFHYLVYIGYISNALRLNISLARMFKFV